MNILLLKVEQGVICLGNHMRANLESSLDSIYMIEET